MSSLACELAFEVDSKERQSGPGRSRGQAAEAGGAPGEPRTADAVLPGAPQPLRP